MHQNQILITKSNLRIRLNQVIKLLQNQDNLSKEKQQLNKYQLKKRHKVRFLNPMRDLLREANKRVNNQANTKTQAKIVLRSILARLKLGVSK